MYACRYTLLFLPTLDLKKKKQQPSNRHKEPWRQASLVRQQIKSWAEHHTEGQREISTCEEIFHGQCLKHRKREPS